MKHRIDTLLEKAMAGHRQSQFRLAKRFFYGEFVEQSYDNALYWAFKAHESGDDTAAYLYNRILRKKSQRS